MSHPFLDEYKSLKRRFYRLKAEVYESETKPLVYDPEESYFSALAVEEEANEAIKELREIKRGSFDEEKERKEALQFFESLIQEINSWRENYLKGKENRTKELYRERAELLGKESEPEEYTPTKESEAEKIRCLRKKHGIKIGSAKDIRIAVLRDEECMEYPQIGKVLDFNYNELDNPSQNLRSRATEGRKLRKKLNE
jgi:hypothetical protein